jgi:hypothetical protein
MVDYRLCLDAVDYTNSENKTTVSDKEAHAVLAVIYKRHA